MSVLCVFAHPRVLMSVRMSVSQSVHMLVCIVGEMDTPTARITTARAIR